jgi:hypothetical protein
MPRTELVYYEVDMKVDGKSSHAGFHAEVQYHKKGGLISVLFQDMVINGVKYNKTAAPKPQTHPRTKLNFLRQGESSTDYIKKSGSDTFEAHIAGGVYIFSNSKKGDPKTEQKDTEEPDDDSKKSLATGTGTKAQYLSTIDRFISFMLDNPSI